MSVTLEAPVMTAERPIPRPKPSFYQPELDTLRFLAFLGVFFFHALPRTADGYQAAGRLAPWIAATVGSGAFGVDLFFGLSAYLITTLLLREKESRGALDVKAFYIRRILRIWPLYFGFVLFALGLTWIGFRSQSLTAPYVVGYTLLAGNWVYVAYGLPQSVTVPLWSISIEEQFYLLWPAVVRKSSRRAMVWIALSLLLISQAVRVLSWLWMNPATPQFTMEYNTFVRMDPIPLGILFALLLDGKIPDLSTRKRSALFIIGATTWIIVGRYSSFDVTAPFQFFYNVVGRPAIALASIAILAGVLGVRGLFTHPLFVYLGKISYGLYVLHEFALLVATKTIGPLAGPFTDVAVTAGGLLITVALAAVSYRFVESPFLALKSRFTYVSSRSV